jgi:hypothetical protein
MVLIPEIRLWEYQKSSKNKVIQEKEQEKTWANSHSNKLLLWRGFLYFFFFFHNHATGIFFP